MQNDLISRKPLIDMLQGVEDNIFAEAMREVNPNKAFVAGVVQEVKNQVLAIPAVDAVPVVRCRECVHYKPKDAMTPGDNRMRCNHPCLDYDIECYDLWLDVEPNDYCKYGEKKIDGGAE